MNTIPLPLYLRSLLNGRSVADVASKMGVTCATLYEWFKGTFPPSPVNLRRYLRALGIPMDHPPTWEAWLAFQQNLGKSQDAALPDVLPPDRASD